ncbi:glycosyl transferase family 1 [Ectothiorhodospira haloalkaliphila]|uniref:Glycosyl transferase family 1 n=1 Tax=Ectothiorhodospira haloalkaliphila TaxID=421628 RepID=W8KEM6_9GAMM|nr:glycosyltransferase [Ectothiorhodospira haloalkaliphila]AHK78199.1 glycosyl transferase family 1 [Ectothiorhodospira haloalkaliphila]
MPSERRPRLVVYTHVYPNTSQPNFGLFVRERMRRVAQELELVVVAPAPWFPFQGLLRRFKPEYRPRLPHHETQDGIDVYHPRYFSFPGLFKWTDGWFQALGSWRVLRQLKREDRFDIIDAHFIYPDGVAARLLSRWLGYPYTITLRGSLRRFEHSPLEKKQIQQALKGASIVLSVADSLRQDAIAWGHPPDHVRVVGNGVDLDRFGPEDRRSSRDRWGLPANARLLVSVGGLTERKGFHRIIDVMPSLLRRIPDLHFVIAGGATPEGNNEPQLRQQIQDLKLEDRVHLLGPVSPDELKYVYSAGDVFALATRFEGWANVFLEASACGLPIVTTRVGGNAEVVNSPDVGVLVPFGDAKALEDALHQALTTTWNTEVILRHARDNAWQQRIPELVDIFRDIHAKNASVACPDLESH